METVQTCILTSSVQQLNLDDTHRVMPCCSGRTGGPEDKEPREASRLPYEIHGEATITSFNTQHVGCGG